MMDHQDIGDNHNAPVFVWCYKRMGEFIRQLLGEGRQPRVMLDYSGTLLHGMRQMGLNDVFDALGYLTRDPGARQAVEQPDGRGVEHPHLPHRLVCTDSRGKTAEDGRFIPVSKAPPLRGTAARRQRWAQPRGGPPSGRRVTTLGTQIKMEQ
jgi:hypothetical protein